MPLRGAVVVLVRAHFFRVWATLRSHNWLPHACV